MQKLMLLCLSLLVFCPAGCAKYWYQEGKSFNECQQAQRECFAELSRRSDFSSLTVDYEIEFMNECMRAKGYREVSEGELPMDVKRRNPESSLHWRSRGIAGSLEK